MHDRKLVSPDGKIPRIEFPAWCQQRLSYFRPVRLDEHGVVLFELVQPAIERKRVVGRNYLKRSDYPYL